MKKYQKILTEVIFCVAVFALWQYYAVYRDIIAFPKITEIFKTLYEDMFFSSTKPILAYMANSLIAIVEGLGIGIVLAFICSGLSRGALTATRKDPP